jgi:hypothetical protein
VFTESFPSSGYTRHNMNFYRLEGHGYHVMIFFYVEVKVGKHSSKMLNINWVV